MDPDEQVSVLFDYRGLLGLPVEEHLRRSYRTELSACQAAIHLAYESS